jgi:hypothetical protein
MTKWAEEELGTLSLGDARLDKRAVVVAEQLAQRPGASIPQSGAAGERPGINEGVRWVESYAHLVGLAPQLATTRLVCVGDRESDTMALFEQAQRSGWAVDMLVRAQHDRVLPDAQAGKLWSRAMATEVDAPAGIKPVVWRLLSNRPVHTLEQAAYILNRKKPPK